ncbi:MAG: ribonuclease activity regulator protein RraA [Piscirickettsiaceae bacterium]|nr:MAG: ribonuclease activity regulator protein RraA [Piscirickettsiaceae bacterium]PCI70876.1 MAG: ribonuclease activity regulator protein RraA [Piscirickettsiaceae bacterium]
MTFKTADLCDEFSDNLQIVTPMFQSFGGNPRFSGVIQTVKIFEDNVLVRNILSENVSGDVLVVDGGGSLRCALLGDMLAQMGYKNGWSGVVVYGCIRDSDDINGMPIGVRALQTNPLKSIKKGWGDNNISVTFAGATFTPGEYLYADEDGIILSKKALL